MPRELAIPALVEREGPRLRSLARRLCRSTHEAEDLVQEVFLRAWRAWPEYEGRCAVRTWLHRIAANTGETLRRRRRGEPAGFESLDRDSPNEEPLTRTPSVPEVAMRGELREIVGTVILGLPERFRLPLVLREMVGLKLAEIAAVLGVELSTVKTRLHRARAKIRALLDDALPARRVSKGEYERHLVLDLLAARILSGGRAGGLVDQALLRRCAAAFEALDPSVDLARELAAGTSLDELRSRLTTSTKNAVRLPLERR